MPDNLPEDNPQTKAQIRDGGGIPAGETRLPETGNHDLRDNIEASLFSFLNRPLEVESAIYLGAEALGESDIEVIAQAMDSLIAQGRLLCVDGMVSRADAEEADPHACKECGKDLGVAYFLDDLGICTSCVKKKHKDVASPGWRNKKAEVEVHAEEVNIDAFFKEQLRELGDERKAAESTLSMLYPSFDGVDGAQREEFINTFLAVQNADKVTQAAVEDGAGPRCAECGDRVFGTVRYNEEGFAAHSGCADRKKPLADDPVYTEKGEGAVKDVVDPWVNPGRSANASNVAMEDQWLSIWSRHPDWQAKVVAGGLVYDAKFVKEADVPEFEKFMSLADEVSQSDDRYVAQARYMLVGGKSLGIGLFKSGFKVLSNPVGLSRGDLIYAGAEDAAWESHGCSLAELPMHEQQKLLNASEIKSIDEHPVLKSSSINVSGDFGMPSDEQPPAPDPEKAPDGWEQITDESGKSTWRSKQNPNVRLDRPQQ